MKIKRYHTKGARGNPELIHKPFTRANGNMSLVCTQDELADAYRGTKLEFDENELEDVVFDTLVTFFMSHDYGLKTHVVKHWTTPALREEWRKEGVDDVETVKTVEVVNALTGDIVEYIADCNTVESQDIVMAENGEDDEALVKSWVDTLESNGDREVVLPPDQWASFFKACEQAFWEQLEDLNVRAETEAAEKGKELLDAIAKLQGHGLKITSQDKLNRAVARLVKGVAL